MSTYAFFGGRFFIQAAMNCRECIKLSGSRSFHWHGNGEMQNGCASASEFGKAENKCPSTADMRLKITSVRQAPLQLCQMRRTRTWFSSPAWRTGKTLTPRNQPQLQRFFEPPTGSLRPYRCKFDHKLITVVVLTSNLQGTVLADCAVPKWTEECPPNFLSRLRGLAKTTP